MAQPKVTINQANGALGRRAQSLDGVTGLVLGAVALAALASNAVLGTPFVVNSLPEAEALGVTAAYDSANQVRVHGTIADFYREGPGAELHVLLVPQATTLADMVDKTKLFGAKLLKDQGGRIKLLGVVRNPPAGAATIVDGLDQDVVSALALAKELVAAEQEQYRYVNIVLEGRGFSGNTASLKDLRAVDGPGANRVSVMLGGEPTVSVLHPGYAAVGLLLGRLARIPVQRNVGRVKSGAVPVLTAGLSNGLPISSYTETQLDVLNDKGYIYLRKHVGVDGFYFNDDHTATPISDDYSGIARGRVMDKASTITRQVYVQELLDEIDVDPASGRMQPAVIKSYQGAVETAIEREMQSQDEISGVVVEVDPDQNVLSTDRIETVVRITPKGVARQIVATLTYDNPLALTND